MAAPWKTILKAQDQLAHILQHPEGLVPFEGYYEESLYLRSRYPDPVERSRRIKNSVQEIGRRLSRMTLEAEPMWVDEKMMDLLFERLHGDPQAGEDDYLDEMATCYLRADDLPLKNGVIIFQKPIMPPPPEKVRDLLRATNTIPTEQDFGDLSIVALHYFSTMTQPFADEAARQRDDLLKPGVALLTWGAYWEEMVAGARAPIPLITDPLFDGESLYTRMDRLLETHPDRVDWAIQLPPMHILYHLSRLLKERLVRLEKAGPSWRQHYRLMPRENTAGQVTVTHWRKYEDRPKDPDHVPEHRDWSCHWPVKSHLRHYKNGKVTEVRSYIKGDRSKPLKRPNTNVHIVDR